ncbi:protein kinase [Anaerolineales bacterium HSG6]|nr:protein kinase [Anaerolineales bacterium HSG6]
MNNDPLIGRQLANFKVERPLGRGGMAQVYYGTDVKLNRPVAIKVIDARYRDQPDYAKRFVREAQTIAVWRHESIIHIHYADDEDGFYYYVMEYIDAGDLSDLMTQYADQGKEISQAEVIRIGKAIASALDYAHKRGVIHRDIKPANVMMASDGRVVVTDFGLAMDVDLGSMGEVFGSARYVAPEQARNSSQAVPQSDVYALGVMMYEMLTGDVPFDDPSSSAVALQHLTMPPPPPRTLNPDLNEATEAVLLTALNKSPQHRYQTGQAFMEALEAALLHNSAVAAVPSTVQPSPDEFAPTVPSKPLAPPAPANTGAIPTQPPANTGTIPVPPASTTQVVPPASTEEKSAPATGGVNPMLAAGVGAVVAILILIGISLIMFNLMGDDPEAETAAVATSVEETEAEATSTPEEEAASTPETETASTEAEATSEEAEATPTEEVATEEAISEKMTSPAEEATATPTEPAEEIAPTDTPPPAAPPTATPEPKPQLLTDSKADFSETLTDWEYFWGPPGSNNWTAMQFYSGNHYGRPCWYTYPNYVRTCNDFGNPGNSDDIAWRWRSTATGPMEIQVQARKLAGGDGVIISVYQDGTDTFPVMQQSTQNGLVNQTINLDEVAEGEFIFFVMNKNGSETSDDTEFQAKICLYECP